MGLVRGGVLLEVRIGQGVFGRVSWQGEERAEEEPDAVSGGWLEVRFAIVASVNLYGWVGVIWKGNVLVALFIDRVGVSLFGYLIRTLEHQRAEASTYST